MPSFAVRRICSAAIPFAPQQHVALNTPSSGHDDRGLRHLIAAATEQCLVAGTRVRRHPLCACTAALRAWRGDALARFRH